MEAIGSLVAMDDKSCRTFQVYRARDPKLGRDVPIKVLPEAFARDAERMERFQREAKVLASLNHPNIASIYGLEDSGGTPAL
jgi:eukaryotic-like serine/threonine-protein kinase